MAWNHGAQRQSEDQKGLRRIVLIAGIAIAVAVGVAVVMCTGNGSDGQQKDPQVNMSKQIPSATNRQAVVRASKTVRPKKRDDNAKSNLKKDARRKVARTLVDSYEPKDRKVADALQVALDDENFDKTREKAAIALKSANPDLRCEAVRALGWFGEKALVDLTKAMSDKNPAVAEAARDQVEQALNGMEDSHLAFVMASSYVETFGEDQEATAMFLGIMDMTAMQFVNPDDANSVDDVAQAKARRADVVTAISAIIEHGGKAAESAKETYESIVGEAWSGKDAANAWANDIEDPRPVNAELAD